ASVLRSEGYAVAAVSSAEEAIALLAREHFDLVLTDIVMPGADGFALLERIHALAPDMPIILISGSADIETGRRAIKAGACDFVAKPYNLRDLPSLVERNLTRSALRRRQKERHQRELLLSYETVLDALLSALDIRDTETEGHSERVTAYTMLLADLLGVPQSELYHIERGALLHDIGKIGVPDHILLKPGPLTPEEWEEMKKHPVVGFQMCARIDFLRGAAQVVLHHHERWDGTGYPDGLRGEAIPLGARIFAVADAFDVMTTDRPYRQARSYEAACQEILRCSGAHFDPRVVEAFLTVEEARWQQVRSLMAK
ncbi:MAG TPA: HD domain-containing phosphohydrolase, partial [Chthonomonadales bacterium]|nr:HD domain-containing phosphohydrolase [Chthonomonadales bacterium]